MSCSHNFSIDQRFCGPSRSGNGGYVCGRIAALLGIPARVRLCAPPPLDQELSLNIDEHRHAELLAGDTLIATAQPARPLTLDILQPCTQTDAEAAARRFIGHEHHSFPRCFVCGPQRKAGDGLRIFAGAVDGRDIVASPWTPDVMLATADGRIDPVFVWAALDCPSAFAIWPEDRSKTVVLGEFSVHIEQVPQAGEPHRIIAWPIAIAGRKRLAGSALFDAQDRLLAWAEATWIEVPASTFPEG